MDLGVVVPQATATVPIEIVVQVRAGEGQEWSREVPSIATSSVYFFNFAHWVAFHKTEIDVHWPAFLSMLHCVKK